MFTSGRCAHFAMRSNDKNLTRSLPKPCVKWGHELPVWVVLKVRLHMMARVVRLKKKMTGPNIDFFVSPG